MSSRALSKGATVLTLLAIIFSITAGVTLTRWTTTYRPMINEVRMINDREAAKPPDFDSRLVIQDVRRLKATATLANASADWLATEGGFSLLALFLALSPGLLPCRSKSSFCFAIAEERSKCRCHWIVS